MAASVSSIGAELDKHAIPFITAPDDDGGTGLSSRFEVNPDAVAYLSSLKGKIAVVAIAGLYRTGKSYLLNTVRRWLGLQACDCVDGCACEARLGIVWGVRYHIARPVSPEFVLAARVCERVTSCRARCSGPGGVVCLTILSIAQLVGKGAGFTVGPTVKVWDDKPSGCSHLGVLLGTTSYS